MTALLNQDQYRVIMVGDVALLQYAMPQTFLRQQVYDPTWGDPTYATFTGKRVIPAIGSIIKNPDDTAVWVVGIRADYTPIYDDFKTTGATDQDVSFYTTDTDRLALYVDNRSSPNLVRPDGKLLITGLSPRSYRLIKNPTSVAPEVISYYKDTTGKYVSGCVPLVKVSPTLNIWSLPDCFVYAGLEINEEISIEIIDETGLVIRKGLLFVANSEFINDAMVYQPMIVDLKITANQTMVDGTFYLFQNQEMKNLHLTATLTYEDGRTQDVPVGKDNCFLYGAVDFVSSFPGLKQPFLIRYYLGDAENAEASIIDQATLSVFKEIEVVVIPNDMKTPSKVALFLVWNMASNAYLPRWMMYFTDNTPPVDVSALVSITQGALNGSPSYFGLSQFARIQVDMSKVMPSVYGITTMYQQDFTVTLRPPTASVKWLIQDGKDTTKVYGVDNLTTRRPRLCYDANLQQYFIPTSYFATQDAFLEAFYYNATPMYDARVSKGPVVPTHFRLRDVLGLTTKTAAPIAIGDYAKAFNVLGDTAGNYVSGTLVVEFLTQTDATTYRALFGAGADVVTGTWQGA